MSKYPQDRFDDKSSQPARIGAHRQPVARRPWWVKSLIAAGSAAAVILAALVGVAVLDAKNLQSLDIPALGITATPTPTPTPTPDVAVVDPTTLTDKELKKITITVLNGTASETLADDVAGLLETQGWPSPTTADAADTTIKVSVVVYGPDEDLPLATAVAESLGIAAIKQSDLYPGARVTVLVGNDFVQ